MALDYTYMFTGSSVFIHSEGKSWLVAKTDPNYGKVIELVKAGEPFEKLKKVLEADGKENLRNWCNEQLKDNKAGITVGESTVEIDGEPVYGGLCRQIIEMHKEDIPLDPLVNFVRKMRQNPSYRIRQQLWGFIEACQDEGGFTLHNDGDIMAYKVVSESFKDCHSGTFDNHPGCIVEMPREEVDDDPSHTCSAGLHFCAYSYVKSFGGYGTRLVLVKVNPKDVVSIPEDYGNAKARCCRYEVVEEIDAPLKKPVYNEEGGGVYRKEWHGIGGETVCFTFRYPFTGGRCRFNVGDVVEVEPRDYYDKNPHIGVILEEDKNDNDLAWKVGFFDHDIKDWVEWWVNEDRMAYPAQEDADAEEAEWFSRLDEDGERPKDAEKFSAGDLVKVHLLDGKIGAICDIVPKASANGETMYHVRWLEDDGKISGGYFIEELLEPVKAKQEESGSLDEKRKALGKLEGILERMCGEAGIDYEKIRNLAEDLADAVLDKDNGEDEDDGLDAEFFVESWLDDAGRKKTARFIEAKCTGAMDESLDLRLALSKKEFNPSKVKRLLGEWMKKHVEPFAVEGRIWQVLRTMMRNWDEKKD